MNSSCRWYRNAFDHQGIEVSYDEAIRRASARHARSLVDKYREGAIDKTALPNIGLGHTGPTRSADPEMPNPSPGLIVIDIDKMPDEESARLYRAKLVGHRRAPWLVDAFVTVSGRGLKAVVATDIRSHDHHRTAHAQAVEALNAIYGPPPGEIDEQCGTQPKKNTMFAPWMRAGGDRTLVAPQGFAPLAVDTERPPAPEEPSERPARRQHDDKPPYESRKNEAKRRFGIGRVYQMLGGESDPTTGRNVKCVLHDDHTPSMSLEPNKNVFYCFGCGVGGDQVTLYALAKGIQSKGEAVASFCDWAGVPGVEIDDLPPLADKPWTMAKTRQLLSVIPPDLSDEDKHRIASAVCEAVKIKERAIRILTEWQRKLPALNHEQALEAAHELVTNQTPSTQADRRLLQQLAADLGGQRPEEPEPQEEEEKEEEAENMLRRTRTSAGVMLRYNLLSSTVEAYSNKGAQAGIWHTPRRDEMDLWCSAIRSDGESPKPSLQNYQRWVGAAARLNEVDPMRDYLESLVPWDPETEESLVDHLARRLWPLHPDKHPEGSLLPRYALGFLLSGIVTRTYQPGAPHHTALVLQGPQGIGKSTMLRELVPDKDMFVETTWSLGYQAEKEMMEKCAGAVLVELGEAIALNRADVNRFKNWLAMNADKARMAYERYATTIPRRFVVAITTNDDSPLPYDPSGYRRFLVLSISNIQSKKKRQEWRNHAVEFARENRDRIWAEMLWRYDNGYPGYPEAEAYADTGLLEEINDLAGQAAYVQELTQDVLDLPDEMKSGKTCREIFEIVRPGQDYDSTSHKGAKTRIGKAMTQEGYSYVRSDEQTPNAPIKRVYLKV